MFIDEVAARYDDWYETALGRFADQAETSLALDLFPLHPGDLILDAGCGTGNFSLKLAEKGARVIGVDIAPAMLAVARRKAARASQTITFSEMDLYQLDYPDCYFDGVASMATFEFLDQPKKAFDELMRVLKPGRHLLIGTINRDSPWGAHYIERGKKADSVFRHARLLNMADLVGFDPDNVVRTGQGLFILPDTPEDQLAASEEERARRGESGGFIVALWKKPLKSKERTVE